MWLDLREASFHARNSKAHFSPSNDSWQTIQTDIGAESCPGCFCCFLFLRPVRYPQVLRRSLNGSIPLDKQTAGCNSPHDLLMSLATYLVTLCDMWRWKWHQWMSFGCSQYGHSLFLPLCCSPPSRTLHPYRSACGVPYTSKK